MIEIRDLAVQISGFALKDISLIIQKGSCHVVIGPTGCGKTTLLEAISGFRDIKKGQIIVDERDVTTLPVHKRGLSYVPQDLAIFPHLTVEENILYGIRHGNVLDKTRQYKVAYDLTESLNIAHLLKRNTKNLSGGERQRVALVRALASGNRYLLLDEPFSALHEGMRRELWFLIKELQKKYGFTIIMISHHIEEAFFLSDYVSVMIDGSIHQTGSKDAVYRYPNDLEVARFFGIKNVFEAEVIGVEDKNYILYCKELNMKLLLPADRMEGQRVTSPLSFGIRAEDVIILRPDLPAKKDNLLNGSVTSIHTMGSNSFVVFKPDKSERSIEIVMPDFALAKLALKQSMHITVSLKSERLFVLK